MQQRSGLTGSRLQASSSALPAFNSRFTHHSELGLLCSMPGTVAVLIDQFSCPISTLTRHPCSPAIVVLRSYSVISVHNAAAPPASPSRPMPSAPAVLTNDLKALMTQAERLLQQLHAPVMAAASAAGARQAAASPRVAARRPPQTANAAEPSSAATAASPQAAALLRPFAVVDEVAEGSPAGQAGVAVGDQMLRFAGVQAQPSVLQAVAAALQVNFGGCNPLGDMI